MPLDKIKFSTASSIGATRQESGVESFAQFITSASKAVQGYGETKYTYDQRIKSENETDDLIFSLEATNKFDKDKLANNYSLMSGYEQLAFLAKYQAENQGKYEFKTEKHKAAFEALHITALESATLKKNKDTEETIYNKTIPDIVNSVATVKTLTLDAVDILTEFYKKDAPEVKKVILDGALNTAIFDLLGRKDKTYVSTESLLSKFPLLNNGPDSIKDPVRLAKLYETAEKMSTLSKENEKNKLASQLGVIIDPKERAKMQNRLTDLGMSHLESLEKEVKNAEKMANHLFNEFTSTGNLNSLKLSIDYSNVSGKGIPDLTKSIDGLGSRILTLGSTKEGVADVRKTLTTLKMALSLGMNKNIIKGDDAIELSAFLEYNNIYDVDKASDGELVKFINLYSTAKKNNYKPMTDAQIDDLIELNGKGSANYAQVAQLSKKYSRFYDPTTAFAMAVRTAEAKPYLTVTDRESVTPGIDMSGTGIRDNEQFTKYIESVEKYKKVNVLGVVRVGDQVVLSLSGDNNVVTSVTHIQKWAADQAKIEKGEKEFENLIVNPIAHINSREGFSHKMYKDSLGNDTIGFGTHINPKDEKGKRRLAIINARVDKKITREMAEEWRNEDYKEANIAARKLGWSYGIRDTRFINALSVVNYQMGNSAIELKFPSVHKLLKSKDEDRFINAAKIIKESLWMKQTPVRATDFMNALIRMQRE